VTSLSGAVEQARKELDAVGKVRTDLAHLSILKKRTSETAKQMSQVGKRTADLARELKRTENPTEELRKRFERSVKTG